MADDDRAMINNPLTPGEDEPEPEPTSPVVDYSPATVAYNEAFENSLMNAILYGSPLSPRTPLPATPVINPTSLPIPLSSHLRTYPSNLPGVLLTHPNGYYTGGPGPNPSTVADFAKKFIAEYGIEDAGQLERVVEEKIKEKMEEVRERMKNREEAFNRNREVERELENLKMQRAAELRVAEKIKGSNKK